MKSRISIEVDFENANQPIIQILQTNSDDVRDKLLSHFCQMFGGSSWCQIKWVYHSEPSSQSESFNRIHITPIKPEDFEQQAKIMLEQDKVNKDWQKEQQEKADPK